MSRTCDFHQCGILTSVDSDEPVQLHFKYRSSKWFSASSLTLVKYSSDEQRLWSDCVYAQANLRLCWSHIPHCWKSHVTTHIYFIFFYIKVVYHPSISSNASFILPWHYLWPSMTKYDQGSHQGALISFKGQVFALDSAVIKTEN